MMQTEAKADCIFKQVFVASFTCHTQKFSTGPDTETLSKEVGMIRKVTCGLPFPTSVSSQKCLHE